MKKQLLVCFILINSVLTIYAQWIGTNPIYTNSQVGINTSTTKGLGLTIGNGDSQAFISPGGENTHLTLSTIGPNGAIRFYTQGGITDSRATTESMRISPLGNVGIGTISPGEKLDVMGNIRFSGGHLVYNSLHGVIDWGNSGTGDLYFRTLNTIGNINTYNDKMVIKGNGNIGIGTNNPISKLHIFNSDYNGGIQIDAPDALIINRTGWVGACKIGINSQYGYSRGLRFLMSPDNTFTNFSDALYLESTGNVSMGITDPSGHSLKIYREQSPSVAISNSISKLEIDVAFNNGDFAINSKPGDIIFKPIKLNQTANDGIIFYIPNSNNDGNSYIKFGDDANNLWMGIFNNRTVRIDGTLYAKKIMVRTDVWSDYVFNNDYNLMQLNDVEEYILKNKHLPNVPSESEVIESGINVSEMNAILLSKIEELTLYIIKLNKEIDSLKNK